jgi:hypothetical protein
MEGWRSAGIAFDPLQYGEKLVRPEVGIRADRKVQIEWLIRHPNGLGLIDRGNCRHGHLPPYRSRRLSKLVRPVADVTPK